MTVHELGSIGEFVTALATLITLVYLALQIRQNTRWTKATLIEEIAQSRLENNRWLTADPERMRILNAGLRKPEALEEDELAQFQLVLSSHFTMFDARYFQYRTGLLDEAFWRGYLGTLRIYWGSPYARSWHADHRDLFSEEFNEFLRQLDPADAPNSIFTPMTGQK